MTYIPNRRRDYLAALGLINETQLGSGAIVPATGTIFGEGHYLYPGELVTNIVVFQSTAGSGSVPTLIKLGLWDAGAPTCLAISADLHTDARWTSTGSKVCALSAPFMIVTAGIYYATFLKVGAFGTTDMQLTVLTSQLAPGSVVGSGKRPYATLKTGATDMLVNDTGTFAASGNCPMVALS